MTATAIFSVVLLLVLIIIAIRIGVKKSSGDAGDDGTTGPLIHTSGIYSIIRKSPREDLPKFKPSEAEIRKYLSTLNEDIHKNPLSAADKEQLLQRWQTGLIENVKTVERGDAEAVGFYYYDIDKLNACSGCEQNFAKGKFVTREEIYKNPWVIPPLHIGCTLKLVPHRGRENLRETTITGMSPLFGYETEPVAPDWKRTAKPL